MPPKKKTDAAVAPPKEDIVMEDEPAVDEIEQTDSANPAMYDGQRILTLPGGDAFNMSFEFQKEDHTLGNALRYIIMKNPDVEFCGYSIPHPSEALMNIRIQTYPPYTARDALKKGFDDLIDLCDVVTDKFSAAKENFVKEAQDAMEV